MNYDTVVLSGGSIKGIAMLGALQYLQDNNLLLNVNKWIGTSVGSLLGYLLAIGYSPIEIMIYLCTHQALDKLQYLNIVAMINGQGAISFSSIQDHLEKMTISKIGFLLSLKELEEKFGNKLICTTYNLTTGKIEILSSETHPTMPCITAVRMSCNLPLMFEKFKYLQQEYVDGAIGNNFPIDLSDPESNVLGILIHEEYIYNKDEGDFNVLEYIYRLLYIMVNEVTRYKIKNCSEKCDILEISTNTSVTFFQFALNSQSKLDMFSIGYNSARNKYEN